MPKDGVGVSFDSRIGWWSVSEPRGDGGEIFEELEEGEMGERRLSPVLLRECIGEVVVVVLASARARARYSYSCAARNSSPKSSSAVQLVLLTTKAGLSSRHSRPSPLLLLLRPF